ncbi:hypothetical protein OROMI_011202 [Orobanche minor]
MWSLSCMFAGMAVFNTFSLAEEPCGASHDNYCCEPWVPYQEHAELKASGFNSVIGLQKGANNDFLYVALKVSTGL